MAHYVGNNPVNYVDPTGHFAIPLVIWGAAALLGAAGISVTPWGQAQLGRAGDAFGKAVKWVGGEIVDFGNAYVDTQVRTGFCDSDPLTGAFVVCSADNSNWSSSGDDYGDYDDYDDDGSSSGGKQKGKQGDNTAKNDQALDALKRAAKDQGVDFNKKLQRGYHDYITGQGLSDYGDLYDAAVEFIQQLGK